MSPVFVTTPFLVQKALKTANSEKRVFSCQTSKVVPEPPSSLVFRRKPAPDVRRAPKSVFCPEKPANSSPLRSSPLVTALSPLAFWVQKCAKPGPVPELLLRRVFRGPTARRGPGPESDSPPRWSVSPPSLSPPMSPLHSAPFLVQKALKTVESEESVWFSVESGLPDNHFAQFSAFGPEKRRIPARRACHRLSSLCHRSLWGRKVRKRLGKAKPAPRLRLVRPWCGPGAGLVRAWCGPRAWALVPTGVRIPTSFPTEVGFPTLLQASKLVFRVCFEGTAPRGSIAKG